MKSELINYLSQFATQKREDQFKKVLSNRTRYLTIVLEDIVKPHNASAVIRTCDCFGIQDIHIIENNNEFTVEETVAMGSSKWLSIHNYKKEKNNTLSAINSLREKGYKIVATTPHTNDIDLENFNITEQKCALLFGTEVEGLSDIALQNSDAFLKIPMYGFTESFNISVTAALALHYLSFKMRNADIDWHLSEDETNDLHIEWLCKTIKSSNQLIKKFMEIQAKI